MSYNLKISKTDKFLSGSLTLEGSKSISNRVLIIQALCEESFTITNLSPSEDTLVLQKALSSTEEIIDVGHAGTSFRFLTAYFSIINRPTKLTGSDRMLQRPIGPLVECLKTLGADISFEEKEGYPPLRINGMHDQSSRDVSIEGSVSSQYISALLLIAPRLPQGIRLTILGDLVSRPYVLLTLKTMETFGIKYRWNDNMIEIESQSYQAVDFTIESDWSAASYYYIMAALADTCELHLDGLFKESYQGDAIIAEHANAFGITTIYSQKGITLTKAKSINPILFENNFLTHPDIAQSISVLCAGMGTQGLFSGLQTLEIKETNRIVALQNELSKFNVFLSGLPIQKFSKESQEQFYIQEGNIEGGITHSIATYHDHRMALSFAALGILIPIIIEDAEVVKKSYPKFWEHLERLGFVLERIT